MDSEAALKLLRVDLDDLYIALGVDLSETVNIPYSESAQRAAAQAWLESHRAELQVVCGQPAVQEFCQRGGGDRLQLLMVIADTLAGLSLTVSPFLVSALIVKLGVRKLCEQPE